MLFQLQLTRRFEQMWLLFYKRILYFTPGLKKKIKKSAKAAPAYGFAKRSTLTRDRAAGFFQRKPEIVLSLDPCIFIHQTLQAFKILLSHLGAVAGIC